MDLLLDEQIIVDICAPREEFASSARKALERCRRYGSRSWIYAGSVQSLQHALCRELLRQNAVTGTPDDHPQMYRHAGQLLQEFSADKHWLAALAGEGPVFDAHNPGQEQLLRALDRFPAGSVKLLTRNAQLTAAHPELTITPEKYLALDLPQATMPFVDLSTQQDRVRPRLERHMHTVLHHGQYIMGPEIYRLERRLAEFTDAGHCLGCSSGTDALLMALMALDIGPGDAVFTSPFSFIATAEVIALLGATPVFVDIEHSTFNLDPGKLELAIQALQQNDSTLYPLPRTPGSMSHVNPACRVKPVSLFNLGKHLSWEMHEVASDNGSHREPQEAPCQLTPKAVIPVDLFGLPADYASINAVARQHGLWVIEDAAQSLGAEYKGRMAGNLAHIGCTSFFPAKPLGCCGDGGAIFTNDQDLAHKLHSIRNHGQGSNKYEHNRIGLNGRLDSLQAAALLPKLDIFHQEIELRQEKAQRYTELLSSLSACPASSQSMGPVPAADNSGTQKHNPALVRPPCLPPDTKSAWAQYSILARDSTHRKELQDRLQARGIPAAIYYPRPLHQQMAFADLGYAQTDFPVSMDCASRIFSLPLHPYLSEADQERIVQALKKDIA